MRKKWILIIAVLAIAAVVLWAALRQELTVRRYEVACENVRTPVRLAVVTDLHGTFYGDGQSELLAQLAEAAPDAVLLVGDIIDGDSSEKAALQLLEGLEKWPCYYVTGNHEVWTGDAERIRTLVREYGVTVLQGSAETIAIGETRVSLCGVDDPAEDPEGWREQLSACEAQAEDGAVKVLLSHRPERVEDYARTGFDVVVAGHAHGGQVRIPGLLNGLYAPNQGWLPEYAGGIYDLGGPTMIVGRGLVRNWLPRIFNSPELVIVDLTAQ